MSAPQFRFADTTASVLLDALRGIAALMVCVYHWRFLFFADYSQLPSHRALWFLPYMLTSLGHQAVLIFFVLSGYLVGGHIYRALDRGTWSWRGYLLQRGVRLWVVLLPALLLGGLIDGIALHRHLAPALYAGLVPNHITFDVHRNFTPQAFVGSALFVQQILTPVFGSNGPLWSLAYEFWYYMLFPLALLVVRGPYSALQRIACALAFFAAAWFVGPHILMMFPVWLLGALLAALPVRPLAPWLRWLACALYCPFFLAFSRGDPAGLFRRDCILAVGTFFFLWILLGAQDHAGNAWYVDPSRILASFSYTLYLVHTPLLMFLTGLLAGEIRWLPGSATLARALAALLPVIGIAYLIARVTEFHTTAVRHWLESRLSLSSPASLHAKP